MKGHGKCISLKKNPQGKWDTFRLTFKPGDHVAVLVLESEEHLLRGIDFVDQHDQPQQTPAEFPQYTIVDDKVLVLRIHNRRTASDGGEDFPCIVKISCLGICPTPSDDAKGTIRNEEP